MLTECQFGLAQAVQSRSGTPTTASKATGSRHRTSGCGRKRQLTGLGRMAAIAGIAAIGGAGFNGANGSTALSKLEALSPKHFELTPRTTC
jgi:hypothetical protein